MIKRLLILVADRGHPVRLSARTCLLYESKSVLRVGGQHVRDPSLTQLISLTQHSHVMAHMAGHDESQGPYRNLIVVCRAGSIP